MYDSKVRVYIEIEQFSNQKYEWNKTENKLELDRVLPYPYFYPYSYGFIENTLANDGDELDALIITDKEIKRDAWYDVYIIGVLVMTDEKGLDEKILCVLEEDYAKYHDLFLFSEETIENIEWFFKNYKKKSPGKWSFVIGFENKECAKRIYDKYVVF
jgi:inorganic pyrophosphatase